MEDDIYIVGEYIRGRFGDPIEWAADVEQWQTRYQELVGRLGSLCTVTFRELMITTTNPTPPKKHITWGNTEFIYPAQEVSLIIPDEPPEDASPNIYEFERYAHDAEKVKCYIDVQFLVYDNKWLRLTASRRKEGITPSLRRTVKETFAA